MTHTVTGKLNFGSTRKQKSKGAAEKRAGNKSGKQTEKSEKEKAVVGSPLLQGKALHKRISQLSTQIRFAFSFHAKQWAMAKASKY